MASRDDMQVWAQTLNIDAVTSTPQRESILPELWQYGLLREVPLTTQDFNQILYLLTDVVKNDTLAPSNNLSEVDAAAARANLDLLQKASNFSDVPDKTLARTNLGIDSEFDSFFDQIYPVGTIYENKTNSANPATYLGRGTWAAEGAGRVVVGAGDGTDVNGVNQSFTAGATGGEYTHTLTEAEIPSHNHAQQANTSGGGVTRSYQLDDDNTTTVESANVNTANTGGGGAHNNVQPYTVAYRWVRTG